MAVRTPLASALPDVDQFEGAPQDFPLSIDESLRDPAGMPDGVEDLSMRLYYMTSLKTAAEYILPERRMRCGRFGKLNDPFELRCFNLGGKEERALFRPLLEHLHKTTGVICFCKHWKSPVMWGHYADSHRGVCLGFDVQPDYQVHEMQYVPDRVPWKVEPTKPIQGVNEELLKLMMTVKYDAWKYEEEWRLYAGLQDPDPVNGSYYIEFGENLTLREVIVGASCPDLLGFFEPFIPIKRPRLEWVDVAA